MLGSIGESILRSWVVIVAALAIGVLIHVEIHSAVLEIRAQVSSVDSSVDDAKNAAEEAKSAAEEAHNAVNDLAAALGR